MTPRGTRWGGGGRDRGLVDGVKTIGAFPLSYCCRVAGQCRIEDFRGAAAISRAKEGEGALFIPR